VFKGLAINTRKSFELEARDAAAAHLDSRYCHTTEADLLRNLILRETSLESCAPEFASKVQGMLIAG
jgi:hypothetical protein